MKNIIESIQESIVTEAKDWNVQNDDKASFNSPKDADQVTFIEIQVPNETLVYHTLTWAKDLRNSDDDKLADFGQDLMDLRPGENLCPSRGRIYVRL